MNRRTALAALLMLSTALPFAAGCSDNKATGPTTGSGNSTLHVRLTDKPAPQYTAVNVTITMVRVHQSSSAGEGEAGWQDLPVTAAMPVDLLTLRNGVLYELCAANLPAGHYQQVRLQLAPNTGAEPPFNQSVVTADGVTHALEVPSGSIKIVHGISLNPEQVTELTLDFDAAQSVKQRGGGFFMTPVIKGI
jgi:hypothetical protein